jgi:DNA-binding Lrp family transcriptional regulator
LIVIIGLRQELAAFAAVIELVTFDAAAERLQVSRSAVSQRIKALLLSAGPDDRREAITVG